MSKLLKPFTVNNLLWASLVLALAGSLWHLASIYASVDGNSFLGWLQGIAVDAGLFALAYSIKVRKVAKRSVKPLWFGVTLFTGISIYGNLAYGLFATEGLFPDWIEISRPYILAGSLPILVLFLSELLSDDRQHMTREAEREARKLSRQVTDADNGQFIPGDLEALEMANEAKAAKVLERQAKVMPLLQEGLSPVDIADELDVSLRTIRRDIKSLNGQNR